MTNMLHLIALTPMAHAQADPSSYQALVSSLQTIIEGASYGVDPTKATLTPVQQRQLQLAASSILTQAMKDGMTLRQVLKAVAEATFKSKFGAEGVAIIQSIGNELAIIAADAWALLVQSVEAAEMTIPIPLIFICPQGCDPDYEEYANLWVPSHMQADFSPDYYYEPDPETGDDRVVIVGSSGSNQSYSGGSSSSGSTGSSKPKVKYDSKKHSNGYWTEVGCFPPNPVPPFDMISVLDMTVACTGYEVAPDMISIDGAYMFALPFEDGGAMLLPVEGVATLALPMIVESM